MNTDNIRNVCINKPAYKYAHSAEANSNNSEVIYHYTNIYVLQSILSKSTLWLTKSDYLNDRMEIEYSFDLVHNLLNKAKLYKKLENRIYKCLYFKHDFFRRCYLLSSSRDSDSYPLWSNYSNNEGYNLGFNVPSLINSIKSIIEGALNGQLYKERVKCGRDYEVFLKDVIYDVNVQTEMINEIFESGSYVFEAYNNGHISINIASRLIEEITRSLSILLLLFKDPCFMAEKECRLIITFKDDTYVSKFMQHRIFNGAFIPYIELCFINEGSDGTSIRHINIGPGNNSDLSKKGLSSFLSSYGFEKVEVSTSKIPLRY